MIYRVQLNKIPNQKGSFNIVNEDGNVYRIDYKLKLLTNGKLSIDLSANNIVLAQSKIVCDRMPLLLGNTIGGNIYFKDLFGNEDPNYEEFNDRFVLIYDTEYTLG